MPKSVLLIDNYDSFVFNLARYVEELGVGVVVRRNDAIEVDEILADPPAAILLSPGPCTPDQAGICLDLVLKSRGAIPILGVCLGHQAIGQALGGRVVRAVEPVHGRASEIKHDRSGLFKNIPAPMKVGRYHSLVVSEAEFPDALEILAIAEDGAIMALKHRSWPVFGVQFHPESILTEHGHTLIANFLGLAGVSTSPDQVMKEVSVPSSQPDDFYQKASEFAHRPH